MRIVVNDIAASKGGALSVLKDFYRCIKENDSENEWIFLLGDNYLEETENIKVKVLSDIKKSGIKKLWFDFVSGKRLINGLKPDAVLSLQNIITFGVKAPQTVYIHQSIPFQDQKKFSFLKADERGFAKYQYIIGAVIKLSAKFADKVIVQTDWMKNAVSKKAHIPTDKIAVATPEVSLDSDIEHLEYDNKSFFYPTSNAVYKNNGCIFKACDMLNQKGISDFNVTVTLDTASHTNVSAVGYIKREEVLSRYTGSVLVFPSYVETFGYPLAEARMLGTVVLSADTPVSREVLKGYENAYFFNPFAPSELAELMNKVISGEITKQNVAESGGEEHNSWLKVIREIENLRTV